MLTSPMELNPFADKRVQREFFIGHWRIVPVLNPLCIAMMNLPGPALAVQVGTGDGKNESYLVPVFLLN